MLTPEKLKDISRVAGMIKADMPNDIKALEGQPMTGRNVHEMFGRQAAAIVTLANIVQLFVDDMVADEEAMGL